MNAIVQTPIQNEIIERLLNSPLAEEARQKIEAAKLGKRRALKRDLFLSRQQAEKQLRELQEQLSCLDREIADLDEQLRQARANRSRIDDEIALIRANASLTQSRAEKTLRETASPLIDETIAELQEELRELRAAPIHESKTEAGRTMDGGKVLDVYGNGPALTRRVEGLMSAVRQAEALRLEPLADTELRAKLDEIKAAIPPLSTEPLGTTVTPGFSPPVVTRHTAKLKHWGGFWR
jgi:chromosome segregation ATPase